MLEKSQEIAVSTEIPSGGSPKAQAKFSALSGMFVVALKKAWTVSTSSIAAQAREVPGAA
ncbi:hypothetical protein [Mycobacterium asiaticum]|uniref:hypothetical protein n=1 Tax=Mycobacterium asiaticum TaxID=1790 RepID=UPI0012DB3B51|nr:hypothetical protein [Mycobacterium asiaticum]